MGGNVDLGRPYVAVLRVLFMGELEHPGRDVLEELVTLVDHLDPHAVAGRGRHLRQQNTEVDNAGGCFPGSQPVKRQKRHLFRHVHDLSFLGRPG